jgi:hypothetical protein
MKTGEVVPCEKSIQDDGVRRMVKTNVQNPDNVQGRLAAPQAPNDIVMNVFIT